MLSSSSPAQKNPDKEDSTGSDPGSEVGLEPETDRFGFLVTKGCTSGSVGPPPEFVRQREAKWINIIVQWDRILLKKTSKVKVQSQKGIPASLRAKCWPLLCGATDRMKQNKHLYQYLDSQPALQSWVGVIERDLDRQFPFHEMFKSKDGHGQRGLFRVLKAYTQYRPDAGYCQAQGPVAAVLLMNMPAEEAFWCLVQICEYYLPGYYCPLLEGVLFDAALLTWVLKKRCPAAYQHLQRHDVEPLMFATDWLMCLFTRHLPFNTLLRVWDLFFCYGVRVLLQVVVVLVCRVLGRAEQRKQCQGQMETLEKLRGVKEQVQEDEDSFIAEVCSVPLSDRDLEKQTERELEKWRKSRPSSAFNPRGRCQGFQMAWARARQSEEEQDRRDREKGNLSIPLARSASVLSQSPHVIHTRWRKGGKVNAHEWEGGDKAVRSLSIGAKEAWRSSTESKSKKVQTRQTVTMETDRDAFEGEHHRPESLSERDTEEESHANAAVEIVDEVGAEVVQIDSGAETLILRSPVCIQPEEATDLVADTQTEAEIPVSNDTRESREATPQRSEGKYGVMATKATYDKEERFLTVTQAGETATQTQLNEETSMAPPQGEGVNITPGPDGKRSSEEMNTSEERAPEPAKIRAAVEEDEDAIGEDIYSDTVRSPQGGDRESHFVKDDVVLSNNSLTQGCAHRCSRSSQDICPGRELSEDLFNMSQSIPIKPSVKYTESQSHTGRVNPAQTNPDSTQSSEITVPLSERTEVQLESCDPLKSLGLLRRVRGDQRERTDKAKVPEIVIQELGDGTGRERAPVEELGGKLSSKERRQRRDRERRKEEERARKRRENELEKGRGVQTRGESFRVQNERGRGDEPHPVKTAPQKHSYPASYADSYF